MKNWAGVYVWNPHHRAHPPAYFCVRARLTTASGHVVAILRGRTHTIGDKCLKINTLRLSLCAKVKPFGFTPMYAHVGTQASAWAVVRPLPAPQFLKEIATHTRTPSCAHANVPGCPSVPTMRNVCAHLRPLAIVLAHTPACRVLAHKSVLAVQACAPNKFGAIALRTERQF